MAATPEAAKIQKETPEPTPALTPEPTPALGNITFMYPAGLETAEYAGENDAQFRIFIVPGEVTMTLIAPEEEESRITGLLESAIEITRADDTPGEAELGGNTIIDFRGTRTFYKYDGIETGGVQYTMETYMFSDGVVDYNISVAAPTDDYEKYDDAIGNILSTIELELDEFETGLTSYTMEGVTISYPEGLEIQEYESETEKELYIVLEQQAAVVILEADLEDAPAFAGEITEEMVEVQKEVFAHMMDGAEVLTAEAINFAGVGAVYIGGWFSMEGERWKTEMPFFSDGAIDYSLSATVRVDREEEYADVIGQILNSVTIGRR